jgi:segregation and condensation protein B
MPSQLSELTELTPLSTPGEEDLAEVSIDSIEDHTDPDLPDLNKDEIDEDEQDHGDEQGIEETGAALDTEPKDANADPPLLSDEYLDAEDQALAAHLENRQGNSLATRLEAILYLKAQPLTLNVLIELTGCDRETVKEGLAALMADFAHRQTALEVAETPKGYSLQLKESFNDLVHFLIPVDLGVAALRTLATIALRGPISQTDLVDFRGSGAYDHVKELVEQGFVAKRRQANGRSFWIQVTDQFYQYFQMQGLPELKLTAKATKRKAEAEAAAQAKIAADAAAADPETSQAELFTTNEVPASAQDSVQDVEIDVTADVTAEQEAVEIEAPDTVEVAATEATIDSTHADEADPSEEVEVPSEISDSDT